MAGWAAGETERASKSFVPPQATNQQFPHSFKKTQFEFKKIPKRETLGHVYNFFISLNNSLFKNIPHFGFRHFVLCCIFVFLYVFFVLTHFTHRNFFLFLEQSSS